jgi:hypothetical protein
VRSVACPRRNARQCLRSEPATSSAGSPRPKPRPELVGGVTPSSPPVS